jgi:hypothetical protein
MSEDDVLFGYRLQLSTTPPTPRSKKRAARSASIARPSNFYRWKRLVDRTAWRSCGQESGAGRGCRTSSRRWLRSESSPSEIAHSGLGPRRIASELRRETWSEIVVSGIGVWRCMGRGLSTRVKRLSLVAGYRAPYEEPREPEPEPHIEVSVPGKLVGFDCFLLAERKIESSPRFATRRQVFYRGDSCVCVCERERERGRGRWPPSPLHREYVAHLMRP